MSDLAHNALTRRSDLRYSSLEDFRADMDSLRQVEHITVGNWTFAQILNHLRRPMEYSLDGWPFLQPWLFRATLGPLIKKRILTKGMPTGFRLKGKAKSTLVPVDDGLSLEDEVARMHHALDRLSRETPLPLHPFFGKITVEEAYALHRRHCELHMSFVRPRNIDASGR